ncbi:hypothetical protein H257_08508 [Aphanomyces astaci]|uniref:Uncharacterized protein n=1 Tax=Aphanomyces astaci TaxID=112090 RepID=W4GD38_APHAT|nr:hypothetical protein H257_08508 [Aphanomyces astaci]ETV77592.1 hypothetical protein H257_08508 [Aphanomyces astaci]|eukprot:XP_009832702.1 hypothetical protein H257_08508 [Aphanomyces astaci]
MARRDTWPMVQLCLVFLHEHATSTVRSTNGRLAADLVAALKQGKVLVSQDKALDPAVVWTAVDLLLLDPCCNLYLFPPHLYANLVRLVPSEDPTVPDVDQLKELLHSPPEHSKHRFFFVVRVLHTIWTRTQSAWTDCVDRFTPLLFRDGVSAVRSINHMAGMAAAKKCLSVVLQHLDFMSRDDTKMMVDDLIQYTVHAVLFEYPPLKPPPPLTTRPETIEPTLVVQEGLPETTPLVTELPHDFLIQKPQESQGQSVLKLQAMVRGWLSRRWSGLALLYRGNLSSSVVPSCSIPTNKSPYCRRQYLALTKRVLYWSVDKLELEKARVKGQLKAFNDTFELNRGSRPLVTDKAAVRPLYELYHFLGLIMDYQRTEPSVDPSDDEAMRVELWSRERKQAKKERLQMRLLLFERHFELCCGEHVQNEDDYGHVLSTYTAYKKLTALVAPPNQQQPHE